MDAACSCISSSCTRPTAQRPRPPDAIVSSLPLHDDSADPHRHDGEFACFRRETQLHVSQRPGFLPMSHPSKKKVTPSLFSTAYLSIQYAFMLSNPPRAPAFVENASNAAGRRGQPTSNHSPVWRLTVAPKASSASISRCNHQSKAHPPTPLSPHAALHRMAIVASVDLANARLTPAFSSRPGEGLLFTSTLPPLLRKQKRGLFQGRSSRSHWLDCRTG